MQIIRQFIKFTGVGMTCFAIDYGIMVLLTEVFGIKYIYSAGISFTIATIINYFLSTKFVFDSKGKSGYDLLFFVVLGAAGLALNQLLMWWLVSILGLSYLIAKLISGILVSFYNFITRKIFLERHLRSVRRKYFHREH